MDIKIFQIFYDKNSQRNLDGGYIPLDNSSNDRPDWSEYWPIRNYFINNSIDDNVYYGFFSPRFKQKTNLDSKAVFEYIYSCKSDLISFSPYFDQAAFALNIFEQGEANHPGIASIFNSAFSILSPEIKLQNIVMNSSNTIFCNYFVAKGEIWKTWFKYCEIIFEICENSSNQHHNILSQLINHRGTSYPSKVFIIERMISFLLSQPNNKWKTKAYNPLLLPMSGIPISKKEDELIKLDALKMAFNATGSIEYLNLFFQIRNSLFS